MWEKDPNVYVTKEDKDLLVEYINAIKAITDKYPSTNYFESYFVTSMMRVKSAVIELHQWIHLLKTVN